MLEDSTTTALPEIVSREKWLEARKALLEKEKELTRVRDTVTAERRRLPMVEILGDYVFDGLEGKQSLLDLFEGRSQLIVQHAMFDPEWEDGCQSCRHAIRDLGHLPHLYAMNTSFVVVSRAPYEKIAAYKDRMGWTVPYVSSFDSDFNYDFHATLDESKRPLLINFRTKEEHEQAVGAWDCWGHELPGYSVFVRDGERIFHTYSTFARGIDNLLFTLNYIDLTPLGRDQ